MRPEQQIENVKQLLKAQASKPPRKKLTGPAQWIVVFLLLISVSALYAGRYAWGFFLGGNFHPIPYWTGWGKMHSTARGDYLLYVEIWPSMRTLETIIPHTFVKGRANLCTPEGEQFVLNLSGDMRPHIYLNTVGEPIQLDMVNWRATAPIGQQMRPSFSIWGRWGRGEITGEDRQGLSQNFLPDGRLRPQNTYATPAQLEDIRLTLNRGSFFEWKRACRVTATSAGRSR